MTAGTDASMLTPVSVLSSYIFRQIWGFALSLTFALALLVLLTQSLRFLDLMIAAGAAPMVFFELMALSLPRLLEIILPIALGVSVLVVGLKLQSDQEIVVMQATGSSPLDIARPIALAALLTSVIVMLLSFWVTPLALTTLQSARQMIQAQFSLSLLQPGVFNFFGNNIMVYYDRRDAQGRLINLILHDQRDKAHPYTLLAQTGELVTQGDGYTLSITNGRRQQLNARRAIIDQLVFTRYSLQLPKIIRDITPRWREPNERTIFELLRERVSADDRLYTNALWSEFHRRLALLILPFSIAFPVLFIVLSSARARKTTIRPSLYGISWIAALQTLVLLCVGAGEQHSVAIVLLYAVSVTPGLMAWWCFHPRGRVARGLST